MLAMSKNNFSLKVWMYCIFFLCRVFAGVIGRLPTWVLIHGLIPEQIKLLIISNSYTLSERIFLKSVIQLFV